MWRRKKYFLTFLLSLVLWGGLAYLIFFIPPGNNTIVLFFAIIFLALFFTFALIFANSRRGFLISLLGTTLLLLKYLQTLNVLTIVLLVAFVITLELILSRK